jgi:hypothetical protein
VTAPNWPRPQWRDSGAQALFLWFVFGDFAADFRIDAARYRTRGTPAGVDVTGYAHASIRAWDGYPLAGSMGKLFEGENAALFTRARATRDCLVLRGEIADPADLDDLRDVVGTITALLDVGGAAVVDPQLLSLFDPVEWRARFFESDEFVPRDHVAILASDDDAAFGRKWIHTRGMRKFARPDIGIRNVPPEYAGHAGQLAQRFADFQALGGIVEEGREIVIDGLAANMHAHHAGSLEDPDFNNLHLSIRWPD